MNRWQVVAGGVSMNLALGSLYAWSVFVLPLEKEFGWTRAQTSWVFTIAVLTFAATFILAGRIQDARGPRICALFGAVLVSAGFFLASFTTSLLFLYVIFGVVVGAGNGFGWIEVVSRQTRARRRLDGWRVWREFGDSRPGGDEPDRIHGLASDVSSPGRVVFCHGTDRRLAAEKSARRLSAGRMESSSCGGNPATGLFARRNAQDTPVLLPLVRLLSRRNSRPDDH